MPAGRRDVVDGNCRRAPLGVSVMRLNPDSVGLSNALGTGQGRRRLSSWTIVLAAIAIAVAAATGIEYLYERAADHKEIANRFDQLRLLAEQTQLVEAQLLTDPSGLASLEGYTATENPYINLLDELDRRSPGPTVERLRAAYLQYQTDMFGLFALIAAGQQERARQFDAEQVRPHGEAFRSLAAQAVPAQQRAARTTARTAEFGTYAVLAFAALLIAGLIGRIERHRGSAARAIVEQRRLAAEQAVLWRVGELAIADRDLEEV